VRDLIAAGADIVKVGVGPGCDVYHPHDDRRRPSRSFPRSWSVPRQRVTSTGTYGPTEGYAILATFALALAAGASAVMIGSWFAGTFESPGDLHTAPDGRLYKESFGMASARAVGQPDVR